MREGRVGASAVSKDKRRTEDKKSRKEVIKTKQHRGGRKCEKSAEQERHKSVI